MTDTAPEAPAPTETPAAEGTTGTPTPAEAPSAAEQAVADAVAKPETEGFDHVLDKYKKEGRTIEESSTEQAKAYVELQSKFGSFTGAPEEYAVELSEGMNESIKLEDFADDPILADFKEMAKEMNMSNEGFNKAIDLYFKGQLADNAALDLVREEEYKALGTNADRRLSNIQDWSKAHLSSDDTLSIEGMMTSVGNVAAIESMIAQTRNAPQAQDTPAAPSIDHAGIQEKLHAKDEFGNPKMQDPAYAREVRKLYGQAFGEEPHNVTVGK